MLTSGARGSVDVDFRGTWVARGPPFRPLCARRRPDPGATNAKGAARSVPFTRTWPLTRVPDSGGSAQRTSKRVCPPQCALAMASATVGSSSALDTVA